MDNTSFWLIAVFILYCVLAITLVKPSPWVDEIDIWCTQKLGQWAELRRSRQQAKDAADPQRVKRRAERKLFYSRLRMYGFFLTALFLLPVGSIVLGIQQRSVSNEAWALIIVAGLQGGLSAWIVVIKAVLQSKQEEREEENTAK